MIPASHGEFETRSIGKPANWDEEKLGPCGALSIWDYKDERGMNHMVSRWVLEPEDIEKIKAGADVFLSVIGDVHPVVQVYVGDTPAAEVAAA